MPRFQRTVGTGMTQNAILTYDWSTPGDVDAQLNAAIATYNRTRFDLIAKELTSTAQQILSQSHLPTDLDGPYQLTGPKKWAPVESARSSTSNQASNLDLWELMLHLGFAADSAEGYAVRILATIRNVRDHTKCGEHDEAMACAYQIGSLVTEASCTSAEQSGRVRF